MTNAEFQKGLKKEVMKALLKVGYKIEAEAKKRCPVETGRLRSSITTQREGDEIIIGTNVSYSVYCEFLYDLPPRQMWKAKAKRGGQPDTTLPFLRPAMLKAKEFLKEVCLEK